MRSADQIQREAIKQHERMCFSNPSRRACKTCINWIDDGDGPYCSEERLGDTEYATLRCEYWGLKSKGEL